jgi:hypothetical protein
MSRKVDRIADEIADLGLSLWPRFGALGYRTLTREMRLRLAGLLWTGADVFVRLIAEAVADDPELFSEFSAGELLDRQDRAEAWLDLRNHLRRLAEIAGDMYLIEQAAALSQAQQVVATTEGGMRGAARTAARGLRRFGLLRGAMSLFEHHRLRRALMARRNRRQAAQAQGTRLPRKAPLTRRGLPIATAELLDQVMDKLAGLDD